jgi:hypothetical protein
MSDDLQQLYAAPKHESPPPTMLTRRRPASHWLLMAWFVLAGFRVTMLLLALQRSSAYLGDNLIYLLITLLGPIGLIAMVAGKRSISVGYVLPSICVVVFAARSIQTSFNVILDWILTPSIYDRIHAFYLLFGLISWALMCYLFYRFIFGLPSRAYFGLPAFDAPAYARRIKVKLLGL